MKKHSKSMNTLSVFTGYEYENGNNELVVKFSQGILEDAWMGNFENLSDDFVREFRRIDRHGHKGETLMTVLRRDMASKDPHVSRPAKFIWEELQYQIVSESWRFSFYRTPSKAARYWQSEANPTWLLCSHEHADRL